MPADLLLAGQRVDVWQADRLVGPGLRVVAITGQPEGQIGGGPGEQPGAGSGVASGLGQADTALTLAPLERLPSPTLEAQAPKD